MESGSQGSKESGEGTSKKPSANLCTSLAKEDENNPLNIASTKFDPLLALYSNVKSEKKNYKQYDNLAMLESALKKSGIEMIGSRKPRPENTNQSHTKNENPFKINRNETKLQPEETIKVRHNRNLRKYMDEVQGPLRALKTKFMENNQRIYVYTRKKNGIRGLITGKLIAFDRHWNLLIENVNETWHRRKYAFSQNDSTVGVAAEDCSARLRNLRITLPHTTIKSINRKYVEIFKSYKQLMIRGEQIVLISEKHVNEKENKK